MQIFYGRFRTKDLTIHICRCYQRGYNDTCHVHGKFGLYTKKNIFPETSKIRRNSGNPKKLKFPFSEFRKIDLIILPNRSNRSNRKKSLNRLDQFIGQRINSFDPLQRKFVAEAPVRKPKYWKCRHYGGDTSRYQKIQFWYRSVKKFIPKLWLRCGLLAWTRFRLILRNVLALSGL